MRSVKLAGFRPWIVLGITLISSWLSLSSISAISSTQSSFFNVSARSVGPKIHSWLCLQPLQNCARVMLEETDRRVFLKRFRNPTLENMQRQSLCKAVNALARKVVFCPYCSAANGAIKKAGALRVTHDKFRAKKTVNDMETWRRSFTPAIEAQKELEAYISKAVHEDLNPLKVLDLLKRISDEVKFILHRRSIIS
jgi:DNA-directed RNA polymerase III subunit RPC1